MDSRRIATTATILRGLTRGVSIAGRPQPGAGSDTEAAAAGRPAAPTTQYGLHVATLESPDVKTPDGALELPSQALEAPAGAGETDDGEIDAPVSAVRAAMERYIAEHRVPPRQVVVPGRCAFGLGADLDRAATNARSAVEGVPGPLSDDGAVEASAADGAATADAGVSPSATQGGKPLALHLRRSRVVAGAVSAVTGGAQGFGEEIVRHLVEAGSTVFIIDLNEEGASALAEELNSTAGRRVAVPVVCNVTDEESVQSMVGRIVAEAGGLDLYVSNAGVLKAGSVKELSKKDFEFVTSVNYLGYFLGVKHIAPIMAIQHAADESYFTDIIQINSKSGLEGSNKNGAYAGGKFGGIGLTQSFAKELVTDGIKVNSICPGNFFEGPLWSDPDRGLFLQYLRAGKVPGATSVEDVKAFYESKVPMGRGCTGEDVVKAIYYIVEQRYETGQAVPVTGGQVMLK